MKRPITHISLVLALVITLIGTFPAYSEDFYPAKVKDISDRQYESAIIDLLDTTKEELSERFHIHPESLRRGTKELE